jgi:hypothetical protein
MDELTHIRNLLEKFYEGTTSQAEEKELSAFFLNSDVPSEYQADKELFVAMAEAAGSVEIPSGLDDRIGRTIDNAQQKEQRGRRISLYSFTGLAAGLLLILSVYLGFLREDQTNNLVEQYAVEDPDMAYEEAKKALELVAEKWNKGTSELDNLNQVNKGIESVSSIKKISRGSREINLLGNLKKADNLSL